MLYVSCPFPLNSSSMSCGMRLLVCHSRQKMTLFSLRLAPDYFSFPSFQSSSLHIASSLISYSHRPLILLETSPVDHDPQSILHRDILTLLMVLRRPTKIFPPFFYSNDRASGEGQWADQCANLNNLSPAAHVSNTVSWGDYTALRSPVSFLFSGLWDAWWKIDHYISGRWQEPQCPAFGLQVAGFHRDEPDGRYLGQWALKMNRHGMHFTMSSKIFHNLPTASH